MAGQHHSPIVQTLWENRAFERDPDFDYSNGLSPTDSYKEVTYNFQSDAHLKDRYTNPWGTIRSGRLLEDLDALAGNIAATHCFKPGEGAPLLVTASVDRIVCKHRPNLKDDMTLSGKVAWVGRSAIEIHMQVVSSWTTEAWLNASFIFVARDPETNKAKEITRLRPETAEEQALFSECQQRNDAMRAKRQEVKERKASGGQLALLEWPNEQAIEKARKLLDEARIHMDLPAMAVGTNAVLMCDTKVSNAILCMPQQRNTRGRVFGGFLMRRAYELAYASAYMFAGQQPVFTEIDEVSFLRPVEIGNLLRFESHVLYTSQAPGSNPLVHMEVLAWITKPEEKLCKVSNKFNFTFEIRDEGGASPPRVARILPATVEEARRMVTQMAVEEKLDLGAE